MSTTPKITHFQLAEECLASVEHNCAQHGIRLTEFERRGIEAKIARILESKRKFRPKVQKRFGEHEIARIKKTYKEKRTVYPHKEAISKTSAELNVSVAAVTALV